MAQSVTALDTLDRVHMDNELYCKWERKYINFCDNIRDMRNAPNHFDTLSTDSGINILSDLDPCMVALDPPEGP